MTITNFCSLPRAAVCAQLFIIFLVPVSPVWAGVDASRCQEAVFSADMATCEGDLCTLAGDVVLECVQLKLRADYMKVLLNGPNKGFAGASATGNVTLVDHAQEMVLTCGEVALQEDRIRGLLKDAKVRFAIRHPDGRKDQAVVTGDVERQAETRFRIKQGSFTLCDCKNAPPPWRLDAGRIDVVTNERATIYGPTLIIDPFGTGGFPITPPLLPLSVPLQSRAPGFLMPKIEVLEGYPQFDQPFFIPLGRSWDVLLRPGYRWSWSALRLGARVRYRPTQTSSGEIDGQYTWDLKTGAARAYRQALKKTGTDILEDEFSCKDLNTATSAQKTYCRLRALQQRVALSWNQRYDSQKNTRHIIRYRHSIDWVSDDRYKTDFAPTLQEAANDNIPSRASAQYLGSIVNVRADADYLLRLGNDPNEWSNTRGLETQAAHRLGLQLTTQPLIERNVLGGQIQVQAGAYLRRFGAWFVGADAVATPLSSELSARWTTTLGPAAMEIGATGVAAADVTGKSQQGGALMEARLQLPLARRLGSSGLTHVIAPQLRYRGVPYLRQQRDPDLSTLDLARINERWLIREHHHLTLEIDQQILQGKNLEPMARWNMQLPLRLRAGVFGPLRNAISARLGRSVRIEASVSIALDPKARRSTITPATQAPPNASNALEKVTARISFTPFSSMALSTTYAYLPPFAERFYRRRDGLLGDIGLGDAGRNAGGQAKWVHQLRPTARITLSTVTFTYNALVVLPLPNTPEPPAASTAPQPPFVDSHNLSLSIASACKCWSLGLRASIPGQRLRTDTPNAFSDWRMGFLFSMGGFQLGSR